MQVYKLGICFNGVNSRIAVHVYIWHQKSDILRKKTRKTSKGLNQECMELRNGNQGSDLKKKQKPWLDFTVNTKTVEGEHNWPTNQWQDSDRDRNRTEAKTITSTWEPQHKGEHFSILYIFGSRVNINHPVRALETTPKCKGKKCDRRC